MKIEQLLTHDNQYFRELGKFFLSRTGYAILECGKEHLYISVASKTGFFKIMIQERNNCWEIICVPENKSEKRSIIRVDILKNILDFIDNGQKKIKQEAITP